MWLSVTRDRNKKHIIIYAVIAVLFGIGALLSGVHFAACICGAVLLFAILLFRFTFSNRLPVWARMLILLVLTLINFILMQTTISCGIFLIAPIKFIMNIVIMMGMSSLCWLITGRVRISAIIVLVFSYIVAIADHLVVQARSFEIQFSDLSSIGTAAEVAGGYAFTLSAVTKIGIVAGVCFLVFLARTHFPSYRRSWKRTLFCLGSIILAVLCAIIIYTQVCASLIGYQDKYWKYRGSERNGFWVNIIYSASATRVIKPDGYDASTLKNELDAYMGEKDGENKSDVGNGDGDGGSGKKQPNVIVIMNETFADVHNVSKYLGYGMSTNVPVTPFIDSLSDAQPNIIKGHALSSVYGGNTANSELEFLSGLSMQFMPRNTVAYNLYINEHNSFTIVDVFNKNGYRTIGMHPENKTNWQRDSIYGYFGFDETYFIDDFDNLSDRDMFREHVCDDAVYNKIIDLYERREDDTPMFTFAVTMQNHGGYASTDFNRTVFLTDLPQYTGVAEFLTSINNSDAALKRLIDYFSHVDDDTIILFYGDHGPSLSSIASRFFDLHDDSPTEKQLAKYVVPYIYWANYDIDCDRATALTSINFLSSWLLDIVGIDGTQFNGFVTDVNSEVMAMNAMGWYDRSGKFHESAYTTPELSESLKIFSYLQYNALFDIDDKLVDVFKLPDKN